MYNPLGALFAVFVYVKSFGCVIGFSDCLSRQPYGAQHAQPKEEQQAWSHASDACGVSKSPQHRTCAALCQGHAGEQRDTSFERLCKHYKAASCIMTVIQINSLTKKQNSNKLVR